MSFTTKDVLTALGGADGDYHDGIDAHVDVNPTYDDTKAIVELADANDENEQQFLVIVVPLPEGARASEFSVVRTSSSEGEAAA